MPIETIEMVQCVSVKERPICIQKYRMKEEVVELTEQIPVFVSKKSGKRVGMGKGVVMRKKQVKREQ